MRAIVAAVAIVVVILGAWAVKGLAEGGSQSEQAPSSGQGTNAAFGGVWDLKVSYVDLVALKAEGVPIVIGFGSDEFIAAIEGRVPLRVPRRV